MLPHIVWLVLLSLNVLLVSAINGQDSVKFKIFPSLAGPNFEFDYTIAPNFKIRNASFSDSLVSIVTQGSLGSLRYLPLMLRRWSGPLEVVAFSYSPKDFSLLYKFFQLMDRCLIEAARQTNVHYVFANPPKNVIGTNTEDIEACGGWSEVDMDSFVSKHRQLYHDGVAVVNEYLNSCSDIYDLEFLETLENAFKEEICEAGRKSTAYPINLLRNVGRVQSSTPYQLVLDADVILGNTESYEMLQELLQSEQPENLEKLAIILPTFEFPENSCVDSDSEPFLPNGKAELIALGNQNKDWLRPFYSKVNLKVSRNVNHPAWYRLNSKETEAKSLKKQRDDFLDGDKASSSGSQNEKLRFAYQGSEKTKLSFRFPEEGPQWRVESWDNKCIKDPVSPTHRQVDWSSPFEPFVIYHSSAPLYDPRFVNYGVNRLSLLCELNIVSYDFLVLDRAFLIHCGLKNKETTHSDRKMESLSANLQLYSGKFYEDLLELYPDSLRSC